MTQKTSETRSLILETPSLRLTVDPISGCWCLYDRKRDQRLVFGNDPALLAPVFDGQVVALTLVACMASKPGVLEMRYRGVGVVDAFLRLTAVPEEDAVDAAFSFRTVAATQLNRLQLLPPGTVLNLCDIVNFRNRHHTPNTWPELFLGGAGCETSTDSTDWQFAPHPSALLFRKDELGLFAGCLDLPDAFGLRFAARDSRVHNFYLDYGGVPHGLPLVTGELFTAPRLRFFARRDLDPYAMYTLFGEMLVRAGSIPDPARKVQEPWWKEPLYCTWIDQCFAAKASPPAALEDQAKEGSAQFSRALTEEMVRKAAAVIEREKLPFRTILLDEGWEFARGQWDPHPERFPDLRRLVDDLHAKGFKVVVWWNWTEIERTAEPFIDPGHLLADGKRNKHGCVMRDYSSRATQEEYLKPLFRTLFSSAPGCYDLDGVKTDFQADKVFPELPVDDPAWRGEENYFLNVYKLFYAEMKKHKPDAVHIGCAGHYWLAEYIDINRTYDVNGCAWREHEERARMLRATCPVTPVAYDFHNVVENLDQWFESARRMGASLQIGNILRLQRDVFCDSEPADAVYYERLRCGLATWSVLRDVKDIESCVNI